MGELNVLKKIAENSGMKICNNQTLRGHTLPDIKTLNRTFFYSLKTLDIKGTGFRYTLALKHYTIFRI